MPKILDARVVEILGRFVPQVKTTEDPDNWWSVCIQFTGIPVFHKDKRSQYYNASCTSEIKAYTVIQKVLVKQQENEDREKKLLVNIAELDKSLHLLE